MRLKVFFPICVSLLFLQCDLASSFNFRSFYPYHGSQSGATRVSLYGTFPINPFNSGVGPKIPETKVFMIGKYQEFEADIEKDSTHETQISIYTKPMPYGSYTICIEIEGERHCRSSFWSVWWRTPWISTFHLGDDENIFAGPPRSLITVEGRIFSDIYGPNDQKFLATETELSIRRAYAGPEDCSFIVEGTSDDLYGISLVEEGSNNGMFQCKMQSDFVGNNNFSFLVTEYGRSTQSLDLMRITGNDRVYMFQTYAEVSDVSPLEGSTAGGSIITVEGNFFDPQPINPTKIYIGQRPCKIIEGSQTETSIQCVTPPENDISSFRGSRGVLIEKWVNYNMNLDAAQATLNSSYEGYSSWYQDSAGYKFDDENTIVKISGWFEAPTDDRYQFYTRTDDSAALYLSCDGIKANAVRVAGANSYAPNWHSYGAQASEWMELTKGQLCYFEGLVQNGGGPGKIDVGALRATTTLTDLQTSNAFVERQKFRWWTAAKKEKQVISLVNWSPQSPTAEVQQIKVSSDCYEMGSCQNAFYKLEYRRGITSFILADAQAFHVEEVLNEIMQTDDVDVSVTSSAVMSGANQTGIIYEVTFSGHMGDEPMISVAASSPKVNVTITEDTKGFPNFEKFSVNFLGRITEAIPVDASAQDIEDALWNVQGASCPRELMGHGSFVKEFLDYEGPKPSKLSESGKRITNIPAFCGSSSLLNPGDIFHSDRAQFSKYSVAEYPWFCFAHMGHFESRLRIRFQYTTNKVRTAHVDFLKDQIVTKKNEWSYDCFDLEDIITSDDRYLDATDIYITRLAGFSRISNRDDFYIDAALITDSKPEPLDADNPKTFCLKVADNSNLISISAGFQDILSRRRLAAIHQGKVINTIEVVKHNESLPEFEIEFTPYDCAYDFPLLKVVNAPVLEKHENNQTQTGLNWNAESVVVTRLERTNLPNAGTFDLHYDDDKHGWLSLYDVPVQSTKAEMEGLLETLAGFGEMRVEFWGDTCYARTFSIWWSSNGGDKKMLQIDSSKVTGEEDLLFQQWEMVNGGAMHGPIPGDMTKMMYDTPQVEVIVNGIPSLCIGNCSFTYSADMTPMLETVSPNTGVTGTTLVLTGTNMENVTGDTTVTIGGVECDINSIATDSAANPVTTIECTTGSIENGIYDIQVYVGGKGNALNLNLTFTQQFSIASFNPQQSFTTGGSLLTIEGEGLGEGITVLIDGSECIKIESSTTMISCIVPPSATEQAVDLTITDNESQTEVRSFTYSDAGKPIVTGLIGDMVYGSGDSLLMINGSNFGTDASLVAVTIGMKTCEIMEPIADDLIQCYTPYHSPGIYDLEVILLGFGAADLSTNNIANITYVFKVIAFDPQTISLFGGQTIEIMGQGFDTDTQVWFGNLECEITFRVPSYMTCLSPSTAKTHDNTNAGTHPIYGVGFGWDPPVINIRKGDTVEWYWDLVDEAGTAIDGIKIVETGSPESDEYNGGFQSIEERSLSGTFSHTFVREGTFYYSSGYLDDQNFGVIVMRGTINVSPLGDVSLGLKVKSNGIEADINVESEVGYPEVFRKKRGAPCLPLTTSIPNCGGKRKKRDTVRVRRGIGTEITVDAAVKAKLLDLHNVIRSNTTPPASDMMFMRWDDELAIGAQSFADQCSIRHSQPSDRIHSEIGSTGENLAMLTRPTNGDVKDGLTLAAESIKLWHDEINNYDYVNNNCTGVCGHYTQMVWHDSYALGCGMADCEESDLEDDPFANYDGLYYIVCRYGKVGNILNENFVVGRPYTAGTPCASCSDAFSFCHEQYSLCDDEEDSGVTGGEGITGSVCFTATVTSITPNFGTIEDTVTIQGNGFGDNGCRVSVMIGDDISCDVISTNSTTIECMPVPANGAEIGISFEVSVNILGYGDAFIEIDSIEDKRFALIPIIQDIAPSIGSLEGGAKIEITGSGFMEDLAFVNIGAYECLIVSQTYTTIHCTTPGGGEGSQTVSINVNSYSAECAIMPQGCEYTYAATHTPVVDSITPSEVSAGNTVIVLTGSKFVAQAHVTIGDVVCNVTSQTNASIECTVEELTAGDHEVMVHVNGLGYSTFNDSSTVRGAASATLSQTSGSAAGGNTIFITGHGFNSDDLIITIGGAEATITTKSNFQVEIITPPGSVGNRPVSITSNGVSYPTLQYNYDSALTPVITSISPLSGNPGDVLTLNGSMLNTTQSGTYIRVSDDSCVITDQFENVIHCTLGTPSSGGTTDIEVFIGGIGNADTSAVSFSFNFDITSFTPIEGSHGGGQEIVITGTGFSDEATVYVGKSMCDVTAATYFSLTCTTEATPSLVKRDDSVDVMEKNIKGLNITVSTPLPRDDYTIIGQNAANCSDCENTASRLPTFKSGSGPALVFPMYYDLVTISGDVSAWKPVPPDGYICIGNILIEGSYEPDTDKMSCVHYLLVEETTATPEAKAGALYIWNIDGSSFSTYTTSSTPPMVYKLKDMTATLSNVELPITVTTDEGSIVSLTNYTLKSSLTPVVTDVTPPRGGTGGGTNIVITGTGFSTTPSEVEVTIGGVVCDVRSSSLTVIECQTNARNYSIKTAVTVVIQGKGSSLDVGATFYYVDVWSSPWTWGGRGVPGKGTLVAISPGQEIMIDQDTEVLEMLLINGGKVFFDEADIELNTKNILITSGGRLEIGTEDEPFRHQATITLHGHLRSIELPIYGTKTIAVREGTLDLHGQYVPVTWTHLAQTASAGSNTIVLVHPVTWKAGDEIVIASTGNRHSQKENEKHTILSLASDNVTITLESTLEYQHMGASETLPDGTVLQARAEVGLLSRNVRVRGSRNMEWADDIPACPDGFNTGEFAQQTCFQGRFGDEMGSDQFGGQIMFHHPSAHTQEAFGRISYVEMSYMGQAFRLGRYAVHFHIMGDMEYKNYVRGCAIHETFNRAVTIHDTHKALVEKNVIFDAMGGAIFIEDGIETGNIIQENLIVFCKQSTSLQNEDITPAAVWVTNPDNIVRDNAAAGGTHFGYWYRMHKHPSGPSHTTSICPVNIELTQFSNNTCHSQGWFGLWIFQEYTPKVGSCCHCSQNAIAVIDSLTVWNCDKGAEFIQTSSVQIRNSLFFNNEFAGVECKMMKPVEWGETGVFNSVIVGHTTILPEPTTTKCSALVLPYSDGWLVSDVTFINYDRDVEVLLSTAKIPGTCADHCGGFHSRFGAITHHSTSNLGHFRWEHENFIEDMDGSLTKTGSAKTVIASTDTAPPSCLEKAAWSHGPHLGMVCPEMRLHRMAWNNAKPTSLDGSLVNLTNEHGRTQVPFEKKRMTHKPGWMALLFDGMTYNFLYDHLPKMANITYDAAFYNYRAGECNIIRHYFTQTPDHFSVAPGKENNSTLEPLTCPGNSYGQYYFDGEEKSMEYIVSGESASRKKRTLDFGNTGADPTAVNRVVKMNTFRCYYTDCIPPPDPNTVPPARERPADYKVWSDTSIWEGGSLPLDNEDTTIKSGTWVVADIDLPIFRTLWIEGVLELDWEEDPILGYKDFTIEATYIFIRGGRLIIGWEDNLFRGLVNIILTGDRDTDDFAIVQGVNMGAKAIGVFGGLDMHGILTITTWTNLGQTANVGDNTITLSKAVNWNAGDEIVITTTDFDPWHTETFRITAVNSNVLTLNGTVAYEHLVETYTYNGTSITIAAEVGLFTRNIKVIGQEYAGSDEESFGGRIIVGHYMQDGIDYTGYARIEDVQFIRMGQEGYSDKTDPRYSLVYWKSGTSSVIKPSYVKRCSFFRNFNTALGAFQANEIEFTNNVVHHTVGSSIIIEGRDNSLTFNLVALMINPGTYRDKTNFIWHWFGGIQTTGSTSVLLTGNVVAGSERGGYYTGGEPCSNPTWGTNTARASLQGIYVNKYGQSGCTALRNFKIHHCYDYGIFFQDKSSLELRDTVITDSGVGIITLFNGPSSTAHVYDDKSALIRGVTIVAITKPGVCPILDQSLDYLESNVNARPPRSGESLTIGILSPSFMSGHNKAPEKPFAGLMQYPGLGGDMLVKDTSFINFGDSSCANSHVVIMPNTKNEDYQHPVFFSGIHFENTPESTRVHIPYPNIGLINPSDCVDMECDGLKNLILTDMDGSFLGSAGTIIPEAEHGWGTDAQRGVGDYRIPKTLLTRLNGSRIPVDEIAPNKGILRANTDSTSCTYKSAWQAYECHGYNHQLFLIESLDWDSETRRISPVALLSDGYIDLENGPQDHGWCAGYTCQLRLSTFFTTVAIGHLYEIHFTGTSPQELRLRIPHASADEAIIACLYYSTSNRLDVYTDGTYVLPKNGAYEGTQVVTTSPPDNDPDFYMPTLTDPVGSNFYSRDRQTICITLRSDQFVDIKVSKAIFLKFGLPSVTVDEFFDEENLIRNLAALLNVPNDFIWVVDIVREGSRKKRGVSGISDILLGVGEPPATKSPIVEKVVPRSNVTENGTVTPGTVDPVTEAAIEAEVAEFDSLKELSSIIKDAFQSDAISEALNVTVVSAGVTEPVPPSTDDSWKEVANNTDVTEPTPLVVAFEMVLLTSAGPNNMRADEEFEVQPELAVLDQSGDVLEALGDPSNPWRVTATINNLNATLFGTVEAEFILGVATFEDLGIDMGGDFVITYNVTKPTIVHSKDRFSVVQSITLRPPRVPTNCTEEEGDESFDKEYVWEGNCSSLCLYDCDGSNEQCSHIMRCGPHAKCVDFECECMEDFGFNVNKPANFEMVIHPEIYCMADYMEVSLDKCGLNKLDFTLKDMYIFGDGPVYHPRKPKKKEKKEKKGKKGKKEKKKKCPRKADDFNDCRGEVYVSDHGVAYSFMISHNFTACNSDVLENDTHITYTNVIRGYKDEGKGIILRSRPIEIEYSCTYVRTLWKTLDIVVQPFINALTLQLDGEGEFELVIGLWKDSSYMTPAQSPMRVHVPDPVYVGVLAEGADDLTVYIDSCVAMSSNDTHAMEYDLITGGCPAHPDVIVSKNGLGNEAEFLFESFVFSDHPDNTTLYIDCEVMLCVHDTLPCTPDCSRTRRAASDQVKHNMIIGPISVSKARSGNAQSSRRKRSANHARYARSVHFNSEVVNPSYGVPIRTGRGTFNIGI